MALAKPETRQNPALFLHLSFCSSVEASCRHGNFTVFNKRSQTCFPLSSSSLLASSVLEASILSSRATELQPPWAQQNSDIHRCLSLLTNLLFGKGSPNYAYGPDCFQRCILSHISLFWCSLARLEQKILSLLNPCLRYLSSLQPNLKQSFHPYCTTSFSSPSPVPYLYWVVVDDQLAPWELFHHWNWFLI